MPEKTFKAGDRVKWDHSQGTTTGKVVKNCLLYTSDAADE